MNYFIQANSEKEYIQQVNQQLKSMGMMLDEKKKLGVYNKMDGKTYEAGELILKPNSQPYLKLEPDKIKNFDEKAISQINQIKSITSKIMIAIEGNKVKKPELEKDENDRIGATLTIPFKNNKTYYIQFFIHEKDKPELEKMNRGEITEDFITRQLTNRGKNGYFEDNCPECEKPTLTKFPSEDNYRKTIICVLCGWANSLKKYLDYKKENSSLSYSEWLNKKNSHYRN